MEGYSKVLVPVSGKLRLARAAFSLEHALRVVQENGEIGFLHCADKTSHLITDEEHMKLTMGDTMETEKLFGPLVVTAKNAGIKYSVLVVSGSPMTHISRVASERSFDVVVMCADHKGPVKRAMGSITERVFQELSVPLLIVHHAPTLAAKNDV